MNITIIEPTAPKKQTKIRVCAYCRVSAEEEEQSNSLENQISYYEDLIQRDLRFLACDDYSRVCRRSVRSGSDVRKTRKMGKSFAGNTGFQQKIVKKFAGSDYLSLPNRALCSLLFKTLAKKKFAEISMEWGCTVPLNDRPWEQ